MKDGKPSVSRRLWDGRPFRIMAYDPGGTSGWAYCEYNGEEFKWFQGEIGPNEHHVELYEHLSSWAFGIVEGPPLEIVCESFEFRQHINSTHSKTKVELISKEYIGVLNYFCKENNISPIFQTASTAKTFIPDKGSQANVRIKQLGLWVPGKVHAMDAYRHLLRYMVVNKRIRSPITDAWL